MPSAHRHIAPYYARLRARSEYGTMRRWAGNHPIQLSAWSMRNRESFDRSLTYPELRVTASCALNLKDTDEPSTKFVSEMAAPNRNRRPACAELQTLVHGRARIEARRAWVNKQFDREA